MFQELERELGFKYLSQISFENEEEKLEIFERGKREVIPPRALLLGKKYRKKIESAYLPSVSVRWVNDQVGHGLFAEEKIQKGAFVGEYTGIVRRNDRLYFEPINNYCYEYPVPDSIGRSYVTDATSGNLIRFVNHSSRPNLKPFHAFFDGYYHTILLSINEIKVGEQLSYDYGGKYWYVRGLPYDL